MCVSAYDSGLLLLPHCHLWIGAVCDRGGKEPGEGPGGSLGFFEVTPEGEIVWEYWSPTSGDVRMPNGSLPHPVGGFPYAVFRATKIPPDHPALQGRELPLDPQPSPVPPPATSDR